MQSEEIRKRFLNFFEKRGHKIIPSVSLLPENDPTVLFTTAGMQPLVPYLLGEKHPKGRRLISIQKCVRTGDIEEIGDNTHLTFFEMMGNWSLGDPDAEDGIGDGYFKKEAIEWSFDLLTNKEEGFGLDPRRLYVTCFEGNDDVLRDEESGNIWREIFERNGIGGERIYFMPAKSNWWQPGPNGPCGPDTEMFYDLSGKLTEGMTKEEYLKADEEQKVVEIWNDVFMEFLKKDDKVIGKLRAKNVDTGSGLERITAILQNKTNVFETDLFLPIISKIKEYSEKEDTKALRIVSDHLRSAVFMIGDGAIPSNTDQGYVLRRLLRRAVRYADVLGITKMQLSYIVEPVISKYGIIYKELINKKSQIIDEIKKEEEKFRKTLEKGMREFDKGIDPFILFTTYGFPFELTKEMAQEKGLFIDEEKFKKDLEKHQELSRVGAEHKFKGGLGDTSEMSLKYHTATHLLHRALREVLGTHIEQRGSNITPERLRFDFTHNQKMTDEEKKEIEKIVNQKIKEDLPVQKIVMKKEEAKKIGALHLFNNKYEDEVSVYFVGNTLEDAYSKEFCGGPHVERTGVIGEFKILKEEAVASGIRRIKAIIK